MLCVCRLLCLHQASYTSNVPVLVSQAHALCHICRPSTSGTSPSPVSSPPVPHPTLLASLTSTELANLPSTCIAGAPSDSQDVVETHLLKEIAVRSDNFFEAASVVADLRVSLSRTYQQVVGLRATIAAVNADVVRASDAVQVWRVPLLYTCPPASPNSQAFQALPMP